jgi:hypothetical protein
VVRRSALVAELRTHTRHCTRPVPLATRPTGLAELQSCGGAVGEVVGDTMGEAGDGGRGGGRGGAG